MGRVLDVAAATLTVTVNSSSALFTDNLMLGATGFYLLPSQCLAQLDPSPIRAVLLAGTSIP
jgi:hypothetical protein